MRPLVWDEQAQERVARTRAYAEHNPISFERLKAITEGTVPGVADGPGFHCNLDVGIRLAFTIEIQEKVGACRHLSAYVDVPDKMPHPRVLEDTILPAFGFRGKLADCRLWFEDIKSAFKAIHIMEPVHEPVGASQ